jgi:hypothetical protein
MVKTRASVGRPAEYRKIARSLNSEAATLYEHGRDRGSNVHLMH